MPSTPTEAKTLNLTALIERLEKADGPDRELDALIATEVGCYVYEKRGRDQKAWFYPVPATGSFRKDHYSLPRYSSSIDAAVALATRIMPGWRIKIQFGENYSIAQFVRGWGARTDTLGVATSERPDNEICLALVTATLRALSAQEGSTNA